MPCGCGRAEEAARGTIGSAGQGGGGACGKGVARDGWKRGVGLHVPVWGATLKPAHATRDSKARQQAERAAALVPHTKRPHLHGTRRRNEGQHGKGGWADGRREGSKCVQKGLNGDFWQPRRTADVWAARPVRLLATPGSRGRGTAVLPRHMSRRRRPRTKPSRVRQKDPVKGGGRGGRGGAALRRRRRTSQSGRARGGLPRPRAPTATTLRVAARRCGGNVALCCRGLRRAPVAALAASALPHSSWMRLSRMRKRRSPGTDQTNPTRAPPVMSGLAAAEKSSSSPSTHLALA
jgi:hypothetical protein